MIPWPRFVVLARQLPRLEAADALVTATGVALGYLDARTPKAGRWKLERHIERMRAVARGMEADG